jgi:hypothetical protein
MTERLLNALRGAVRDLVDKRLWPVALALVVALVAVPVVIGSSAPDVPPPPPTPAPAGGAPAAAITVADPAVVGHSRPGAVNDPFYDPPAPKTAPTASSPATSAAAATRAERAPASSATPAPRTARAQSAPTAPSAPAAPATRAQPPADRTAEPTVFRTRVRWGDRDAEIRGLSRLQPMGGISSPALLYLGTTMHGKRAVFLLGPRAESSGDGRCAERSCRVIALKAGDRRAVVLRGADGGVARRFTLAVEAIARRVMPTPARARRLRARVHPWGRDALRAMIKDRPTAAAIGGFAYDRAAGAVVAGSAT